MGWIAELARLEWALHSLSDLLPTPPCRPAQDANPSRLRAVWSPTALIFRSPCPVDLLLDGAAPGEIEMDDEIRLLIAVRADAVTMRRISRDDDAFLAALHDGEKYLVERWRNVVFTPASNARLKDAVSRNWKALGLGVTKSFGANIPALPGVADEMRGIINDGSSTKGILPGTIKLDEQFTQDAMLAGLRQRPPVVHVASHFQFKPGNETDSALLLGDGKFLSLAQIKTYQNVFGGVELLTLSACNTATSGSGADGKEVEGFGVLAQRQGAKAVVASLWPVADRSTKNLMQEFYRVRESKTNITKAEAMRQAQTKLLRGELQVTGDAKAAREILHNSDKAVNQPLFKVNSKSPYAHPYYWAPFILIGNWR